MQIAHPNQRSLVGVTTGSLRRCAQQQQGVAAALRLRRARAAPVLRRWTNKTCANIMNTSRYAGRGFTAQDYDNLRRGLGGYKTSAGVESK